MFTMGVDDDSSRSTMYDRGLEQPRPAAAKKAAALMMAGNVRRLKRMHVPQRGAGGRGARGRTGDDDDRSRQHHQSDGPPEPVLLIKRDGALGSRLRRSPL